MELNLWSGNSLLFPNMNVVFDDSIFQVDEDKNFSLSVNAGFNSSVTFPSYAESVMITGYPYNFNTPLNIPSTVKNLSNSLRGCNNYNQPTVMPNGVISCQNMLIFCGNFNCPITIPNSVQITRDMFAYGYSFNQPITLPTGLVDGYHMFYNSKFNSPVTIPDGIKSCFGVLSCANNFNQPVTIPDNVVNCQTMFAYMAIFNSPVTIGNNVTDCSDMFEGSWNYNQPTVFNGTAILQNAIRDCMRFNSPVTIKSGAKICNNMFMYSRYFNRHVVIPNGVTDVSNMLAGTSRFNSTVIIPGSVKNMWNMLEGISGANYNIYNSAFGPVNPDEVLQQPIYLYAYNVVSAQNIFGNNTSPSNINLYITGVQTNIQFTRSFRTPGVKRLNIFTDDSSMNLLYTTPLLSNGGKPTWTNDATNGCIYNTATNIYIYNNWDGNAPSDLGYNHLRYYSRFGDAVYYDEYVETGANGEFVYGDNSWSNVPNGTPVTGILNNITSDKDVYYAGVPFDYIRQRYGVKEYTVNNKGINFTTDGTGSTGIIINGNQIAGVVFRKTIYSGGNQSGHCQVTATLPSIVSSGSGRLDYDTWNNGHYYGNNGRDIFLTATNGTIQAAVTYREGNVFDNGVRFMTEANGSSNAAMNITVVNNAPVVLNSGDAVSGVNYGGLAQIKYPYSGSNWGVVALAPVTDGINNYNAGDLIRQWSYAAWNAFTVWPQ